MYFSLLFVLYISLSWMIRVLPPHLFLITLSPSLKQKFQRNGRSDSKSIPVPVSRQSTYMQSSIMNYITAQRVYSVLVIVLAFSSSSILSIPLPHLNHHGEAKSSSQDASSNTSLGCSTSKKRRSWDRRTRHGSDATTSTNWRD